MMRRVSTRPPALRPGVRRPVVQRGADDRAFGARLGERAAGGRRWRDAAAAEHAPADRSGRRARVPSTSGPPSMPSRPTSVYSTRRTPASDQRSTERYDVQIGDGSASRAWRRDRRARRRRRSGARRRARHPVRQRCRAARPRPCRRRRASAPCVEQRAGGVERADAAADLDRDVSRLASSAGDRVGVAPHAVARAVEVDDVQSLGALGLPVAGHLSGIVAVRRLAGKVALDQLDAPPAADVNRRNRLEDACHLCAKPAMRPKLRYSLRPRSALFSGWNWVATTLSRATIAAKSTP